MSKAAVRLYLFMSSPSSPKTNILVPLFEKATSRGLVSCPVTSCESAEEEAVLMSKAAVRLYPCIILWETIDYEHLGAVV